MLDGSRGVVVAVSGGPDSVALLDMLMRLTSGDMGRELGVGEKSGVRGWGSGAGENRDAVSMEVPVNKRSDPRPPTPIPRLHIAHLDHMLRGRESAEDADFVRALAEKHGLQVTIGSAAVGLAAEASGRSVEELAREIRYKFLLDVANETGCDRIAAGHTMTDQAETFLLRLIRGAGSRGLASMRPVIRAHAFEQKVTRAEEQRGVEVPLSPAPLPLCSSAPYSSPPLLIRPLLCITRKEIEDYCRERGLEFRTDFTNESLHYTRNRLRNEIFPALKAINPRVVEAISRAAGNLASDQDALQNLTSSRLENARLETGLEHRAATAGTATYSIASLMEQPEGLRRRMIVEAIRLLRDSAIVEAEGPFGEVTSTHVASIESLLKPHASGKYVTLPGGLEVWREFDALVFKSTTSIAAGQYQTEINSGSFRVEAGGFAFLLRRGVHGHSLKAVIEETQREARLSGLDWMTVAVDDRALPERLLIRPRRPGERARVVGQTRTKKLKNLMIDHRIPSSRRANWPIVTTPSGCYVWSPGLPPALQFAARDETKGLAVIRASAI
jgi:tRNA(Ile)-lysidine synthase